MQTGYALFGTELDKLKKVYKELKDKLETQNGKVLCEFSNLPAAMSKTVFSFFDNQSLRELRSVSKEWNVLRNTVHSENISGQLRGLKK